MRVGLKTKNKGVKHATYPCRKCKEPIVAGEKYYEWKHRYAPPNRQHATHGEPRQSELCTSKMSDVYAAIEAVEDVIETGRRGDDASGLEDALNQAAEEVRNVAQEYEDGLGNMPDSLQQSSKGEEIQEKIDALNEFADSLENAAGDVQDWDMSTESPEPGEDHTEECASQLREGEDETDRGCDCGFEEIEEAKEQWENERDEKLASAFSAAEDALQELSI